MNTKQMNYDIVKPQKENTIIKIFKKSEHKNPQIIILSQMLYFDNSYINITLYVALNYMFVRFTAFNISGLTFPYKYCDYCIYGIKFSLCNELKMNIQNYCCSSVKSYMYSM